MPPELSPIPQSAREFRPQMPPEFDVDVSDLEDRRFGPSDVDDTVVRTEAEDEELKQLEAQVLLLEQDIVNYKREQARPEFLVEQTKRLHEMRVKIAEIKGKADFSRAA